MIIRDLPNDISLSSALLIFVVGHISLVMGYFAAIKRLRANAKFNTALSACPYLKPL